MASIDEARRKAEERKIELEALKAAQKEKRATVDRTPVVNPAPVASGEGNSNPFDAPSSDAHGEELARQRARFTQRQQLPEVANAGKPNAQDEKIRLFEAAKAKYLAKQVHGVGFGA